MPDSNPTKPPDNTQPQPSVGENGNGPDEWAYRVNMPIIIGKEEKGDKPRTPTPTRSPTQPASPPGKTPTRTGTPQRSATPTRATTGTPTRAATRTATPTSVGSTRQWGIYIDLKRCIGCNACSLACKQEFNVAIGERWNEIYGAESGNYPTPSVRVMPMLCHHCGEARCKSKCDALGHRAILQRPDGIVYVDPALCVGCQQCLPTCRYKAMWFNTQTSKAEKCDFCRRRIDAGLLPACVITCLAITREFGAYDELKARHPAARSMGGRVKILYDNLGGEPEHDRSTGGYRSPVECHH